MVLRLCLYQVTSGVCPKNCDYPFQQNKDLVHEDLKHGTEPLTVVDSWASGQNNLGKNSIYARQKTP